MARGGRGRAAGRGGHGGGRGLEAVTVRIKSTFEGRLGAKWAVRAGQTMQAVPPARLSPCQAGIWGVCVFVEAALQA
jgi:hypothetical protein